VVRLMGLSSTVYRLNITLSDVDRGVYEKLNVRTGASFGESALLLAAEGGVLPRVHSLTSRVRFASP
jgi:hypothetical protein